jgi:serine-type D-Ala-D-Ala endopeptidase (penicillin-binding protein 7)
MRIYSTMSSRSRTITIDLRGFWFSIQLLLVVGTLAGIAYAGLPLVRHAMSMAPGLEASSLLGLGESEVSGETLDEWALASIALSATTTEEEPEQADDFTALLGAVPNTGKFVRVDTAEMRVSLYEDGVFSEGFTILQVPLEGSPDEVPEGLYTIVDKVSVKLSTLTLVRFPHYVRFDDRYALHGKPTDADGGIRSGESMEGSIILDDADAKRVYAFVTAGVPVFVTTAGDQGMQTDNRGLVDVERDSALPATSARSFFVADLESGQVYLEKESLARYPIASITKFVTASVASELVPHTDVIEAPNGETYTLGDLQYLLLLRSDNGVADAIASHVGTDKFIATMNTYVQSLGLSSTSFADPSGLSPRNISTTRDLALFAKHLYEKKPFVLDISSEESMTITSSDGMRLGLENQNKLAWDPHFRGGKLGFTDEALQTSLAIFSLPVDGKVRPVVVVILGSNDWKQDTRTLLRWLLQNTKAIER